MSWRGVQLGLLILAIGLGGVGAVSYIHPIQARVWDGYDTKCLLTTADGNIRVLHLVADFVASYTAETPLDQLAGQWSDVPTKGLAWGKWTHWLDDGTTVDASVVGCTFVVPLVLSAGLAFFIRVLRKQPWRVRILLREVLWPSDYDKAGVAGRIIRRSLVTALCLGGAASTILWVVSYKSTAIQCTRWILWCGLLPSLESRPPRSMSAGSIFEIPRFNLTVRDGLVTARYFSRRGIGTASKREFRFAGIGWEQDLERDYHYDLYMGLSDEDVECLRTTEVVSAQLVLPLSYPVFLFWAWPLVAFFLGPWRQSGKRAKGFCIRCDYNLTGLVEPRCPECGTPLLPDQVPAMQDPRIKHGVPGFHTGD